MRRFFGSKSLFFYKLKQKDLFQFHLIGEAETERKKVTWCSGGDTCVDSRFQFPRGNAPHHAFGHSRDVGHAPLFFFLLYVYIFFSFLSYSSLSLVFYFHLSALLLAAGAGQRHWTALVRSSRYQTSKDLFVLFFVHLQKRKYYIFWNFKYKFFEDYFIFLYNVFFIS